MGQSFLYTLTRLLLLVLYANINFISAQDVMPWLSSLSMCGCPDCTPSVFDKKAGQYSCLERIQYLIFTEQLTEEQSCSRVANEFRDICGKCDTASCQASLTVPERDVEQPPDRIPVSAGETSNEIVYAQTSSTTYLINRETTNFHCECASCTEDIFDSDANGHSFSSRVEYLLTNPTRYPTEKDACRQLARVEFPNRFQQCDPENCKINTSPAATATTFQNTASSRAREMDLYRFPPAASRTTYENVWGDYTIQVKSDPQGLPCGPGENFFSNKETVSRQGNELKLQYKKVGNQWLSSEVRVLRSDSERFQYGTYAFSVKSVRVVDSVTNSLVSTVLPQSLVLGLFTWDPTEDYAIHENYNHEVDIELARWNNPNDADAQFLVQPPGHPQTYRFFTGSDGKSYQQGGQRVYGFEWRPTEIEWFANAGSVGERFIHSTQKALDAGEPDYNQCMPLDNNVEVRINLWNVLNSTETPPGMLDTHVVEVVIDNFQFVPNGLVAVPDGNVCSKDCHCGATSQCLENKCVRRSTRGRLLSEATAASQRKLVKTGQFSMILVCFIVGGVTVAALLLVIWPRSKSKLLLRQANMDEENSSNYA